MEQTILAFIDKFKEIHGEELEDIFSDGWCYYFAVILRARFTGRIYYLPVMNHFVCKIGDLFYDINGIVIPEGDYYPWDEYKYQDIIHTQRIIRDCIMKLT